MKKILTVLLICWALFPIQSAFAASDDAAAIPILSRGHIQDLGDYPADGSWVESPNRIGTVGQSKRIEGFELKASDSLPADIELRYNVHVQNIGWLYDENDPATWAKNGEYAGTRGDGLRIEAVKIVLLDASGNKATGYHIRYQGHVQNVGDLPADSSKWYQDGEQLGTVGSSLRLEALKLEIVKDTTTGADLSAYTALLGEITGLNDSDYTKTSWANLQTALTKNKVTAQNTAVEITTAVKNINDAIDQLEDLTKATVYAAAGTYGPTSSTETITHDVIITSTGVILQNLTIEGNLIIDEAVGDGDVTLNNVTVTGETRVRGGGKNSIHINGGQYRKIVVEKTPTGEVRIVATDLNGIDVVLSENAAGEILILEGSFDSVTVDAPDTVIKTQGQTSIKTLDVTTDAQNSSIDLGNTTTVAKLALSSPTKVTGTGTVSNAEVAADNVSFEKAPENYTVDPEVIVPPVIPTPTPQPGGGGGTSKISLSVATAPTITQSKTYDGTTATNVSNQVLDPAVITGIVAGDTVTISATATYDNKKAGSGKTITITYSLSGSDAGKYNAPAKTTVKTGEILKATLTLPAPTTTKAYNKNAAVTQTITPTSGKFNGDTLTVTETTTFSNASAGTGKSGTCSYALTGTDAINYNVPADQSFSDGEITAKLIAITGTTVETSKTYNRNDVAAIITNGTSTDIISGDVVTIAANAYYENGSAGTNKPIYVTYTLTGAAAANYQVTYTNPQTLANYPGLSFIKLVDNGVISKVQLNINQAPSVANKTYDGNLTTNITNTALNTGDISGICSGDTVSLTATASFAGANAGENKPVTIAYQISGGSGSNNYLPPVNGTATATISPLEFDTTRVIENPSKEYDGTSTTTVNVGLFIPDQNVMAIVGPALQNNRITFDISADYTDGSGNKKSAVGSAYTIAYSFKLSGPDAGNFKLTGSDANNMITGSHPGSSITQKKLTVSAAALGLQTEKTYDGNASTNVYELIIRGGTGLTGIVGTDKVVATASSYYADANAGDRNITTNFTLSGDDSGNYYILPISSSGKINPVQLTVDNTKLPAIAATRKYDATTDVYLADNTTKLSGYALNADAVSGLINSEAVTVKATASYDTKNVSSDDSVKPVTIHFTLDGDAAKNYLAPADDTSKTANMTRRQLGYTNVNLEPMKKQDGSCSANITAAEADSSTAGGMDGVVHHAGTSTLENVYLGTYSADYYDGDQKTDTVGIHAIKITGTLTGADAGNYVLDNYTVPGKIIESNAVISTLYNGTDWSVYGNLTPPSGVANFKLFYAKQAGATTFYGYDSTGQIYSSTNLSTWTTGDQVPLDGIQLIGIDSSSYPLAIATTPDTDQSGNTTHPIYSWTGNSWNNNYSLQNIQPLNPTYYTDGSSDYLIYQDENNNVINQVFSSYTQNQIGSYPGPSLPSSFTNSLLVYNGGSNLMLYAY